MPAWVEAGSQDYARRLPRELTLEWIEINPGNRKVNADQAKREEGEQILSRIRDDDFVIALDERGKSFATIDLANSINSWQRDALNPVFLIGGADGLAEACLRRAQLKWALSELTFPHALVRVILTEQIYRAAMINANHPYHRP